MDTALKIKFWGTRGLISSPHKNKDIYGGNTTCIQILYKKHLIIVDTGFGVTNLGEKLMQQILQNQEVTVHILYTHYHWDHTQGLPFFHPIYFPTSTLHIYSPLSGESAMEQLDVLFDGSYSPFAGINSMPSKVIFHEVKESIDIDGLKISYTSLDHGWNRNLTYAYRFDSPDKSSLVIATDHEARAGKMNDGLIKFSKRCSMLVHDGQYTEKEYQEHQNWGHSSIEAALENAIKCKASKVLLTHHSPHRTDEMILQYKEKITRDTRYKKLDIDFARENIVYPVR